MPSLPKPSFLKSSSPKTPSPKRIDGVHYKNLREFTVWHPWGVAPGHTKHNEAYIPVTGAFVKRLDYNAALQRLIDYGWRTASASKTTPQRTLIGAQRGAAPAPPAVPQRSLLRQAFGNALVANFNHVELFEQVAAYTFRGDRRPPEVIKADGGFHPPSTRMDDTYVEAMANEFYKYLHVKQGLTLDDDAKAQWVRAMMGHIRNPQSADDKRLVEEFAFWRAVMRQGEMHLQAMTDESFLKGYISTARDIDTAFMGATGALAGAKGQTRMALGEFGWIYVLRVRSGFLVKKGVGGVTKEEAEIAHLGSIPWEDVMGFMPASFGERPIYLRNQFDQQDYPAFKQVLGTLSSKAT
jgi:hypothetical protein